MYFWMTGIEYSFPGRSVAGRRRPYRPHLHLAITITMVQRILSMVIAVRSTLRSVSESAFCPHRMQVISTMRAVINLQSWWLTSVS
jgi:hypothetical protein